MSALPRRTVLAGGAAVASAAALAAPAAAAPRTAADGPDGGRGGASAAPKGDTITPSDPRYPLYTTGNNQRFVARPEYVKTIRSTADAEAAVREAVRTGKRVALRSGGHCFADFTSNPQVQVLLDLSEMNAVGYDPARRAFFVEPGARLYNVYEGLYKGWGVTIPGGICWSVGAGGHIAGGGYGLLSRAHGLVVDHLYAVQVVTVGRGGQVRTVVATREPDDPNRDLWWAHTGGGGGNFGVVTRYWFRSPGATGTDPSRLLVRAPSTVLVSAAAVDWSELTEAKFARLLKNFGAWHEANSAPTSPYRHLSSLFNVSHKAHGSLGMFTQIDAAVPGARRMIDDYMAALTAGTGVTLKPLDRAGGELPALPGMLAPRELPWLQASRLVGTDNPTITNPTARGAHKSAYMRKNFTDHQIAALYKGMTRPDFHNPDTMLVLFSFGGQVNAVAENATANAQRSSAFKMCLQTFWTDAADDPFYLGWAREVYEDFFAATGGVPVIGERTDGCYINYPDRDVTDPARNRSGVPWTTLYYKGNYPRLQQVKKRWDPTDFFRHSMSVKPAR
ncbi:MULTISPECIES: FAD-dependent oxidoreductase [Streptomycetaceae]|uniref:Putative secreted FAD-linked oxidase n=1 Tax=Streptantibioticus cattleyicolor (strain ATCC 35852 / DSM 46488 / JCM 4925 / NBRC 14057 / NRRL 8057) TaxID=1003195 RepID=F8JV05_STREN|nr:MULTISPECIES: FAD-binding protein [Streptomycetaceae]AEW98174.1 putative secreted FAD-linked oxidase [Streptantibioticus cattleyicolor NRRL 8057 = DSM 46488]MYS62558.1 FAD-binding protein [Streptomyces sp. SID5468]CCB78489.1 FAD/FMN-containing dehydrogenase [Streptantibioticus cattleyicolor NRRL 8057 = DSM 46488]